MSHFNGSKAKFCLSYSKKHGVFKNSTGSVIFNPKTVEALSYRWWRFVRLIKGRVVFNNYRYSASTNKHQYRVKALLRELKIKIDREVLIRESLPSTLRELNALIKLNRERDKQIEEERRLRRNKRAKELRALKKAKELRDKELRESIESVCAVNNIVQFKRA